MGTRPGALPGRVLLPCPTGPRQRGPLTPCHALKEKPDICPPYAPTAQVQLPSLPLPLPFCLSAGFLTSNLPFLSTHRNLSMMTLPSPALLGPAPLAGAIRGRGARGCSLQQSPGPWTGRAGRARGKLRATPSSQTAGRTAPSHPTRSSVQALLLRAALPPLPTAPVLVPTLYVLLPSSLLSLPQSVLCASPHPQPPTPASLLTAGLPGQPGEESPS